MKGGLAECARRGGEAQKRQCLLIAHQSSTRKKTPRQEHYSVAAAGQNHSRVASQGDWRPVGNGPSFAKHRCYNWSSDKTNTLPRSERLPVLGHNDSPSENREYDPGQHRSAECPCRRTPHCCCIQTFQRHFSGCPRSMTRQLRNSARRVDRTGVANLAREKCVISQK